MFPGTFMVECINTRYLGIKELPDTFADEIIDSLHIHFGNQALLNTVNYSKFSISLFGFVKEPGVFKSHTHTVREGTEQADIRFGKSVFMVEILEAYISTNN